MTIASCLGRPKNNGEVKWIIIADSDGHHGRNRAFNKEFLWLGEVFWLVEYKYEINENKRTRMYIINVMNP